MLLKKSIAKTKNFFIRTHQNLKTFLFGGYKKLPKAPSLNPFSCSSSLRHNGDDHHFDHFYKDFIKEPESDQNNSKNGKTKTATSMNEAMKEDNLCRSPVKIKQEKGGKEEELEEEKKKKKKKKEIGISRAGSRRRDSTKCLQSGNDEGGSSYLLAQKMKDLEMMDVGNVDHELDVEEVLHYYSRLKSPVYLDIVDRFFIDMHSEFLHPQPSIRKNKSKGRLRPLKL